MQEFLPVGERSPLPSAVETQRRASRAVFSFISTGSALQREGLTVARTATHLPLNAVERTTGADPSGARARVDDRFDAVREAFGRAEERFLTVVLSTPQSTAGYARFVDDSVERACPDEGDAAN